MVAIQGSHDNIAPEFEVTKMMSQVSKKTLLCVATLV